MTAPIPSDNKIIWPPNYVQEYKWRQERLTALRSDSRLLRGAIEYYSNPVNWPEFIQHWMITYDPRNHSNPLKPTTMPFVFFPRQKDFIDFLYHCLSNSESGLVEKSRDMGATWLCCAFSICLWLFSNGSSVGWGSRKQDLVDKIGDPDSIFEKMRMLIRYLPDVFLPNEFTWREHSSYMKLINPENGSTITGESGDQIGRGGRKSIYFKDESAHYERPELIESALGDNTDVQIDISSVNGTANVYARRRKAGMVWNPGQDVPKGITRVFIFDWRQHPEKDQEWYDRRRDKAEREGLLHIFAQEVDRDYASAVEGVLIPAIWVQAAVGLDERFPDLKSAMYSGLTYAGMDVADEGGDLNSLAVRKGIVLTDLEKWAMGDTGVSSDRAIIKCKTNKVNVLDYDCIGVGAGVKAETNRLKRNGDLPKYLKVVPWNASSGVLRPKQPSVPTDKESPKNEDLFSNLKAQAYWSLRTRFEKTYKFVNKGVKYPVSELICLPKDLPYLEELTTELSQPTYSPSDSGKIKVNKKPSGTRSPNLSDGVNIAFFPWQPKNVGTW